VPLLGVIPQFRADLPLRSRRGDASDARGPGGIDARRPEGASNVPKGCGDLMQHRFDALPDAGPPHSAEAVGNMPSQDPVELPDLSVVLDLLPE
jgi:hypothetical protein